MNKAPSRKLRVLPIVLFLTGVVSAGIAYALQTEGSKTRPAKGVTSVTTETAKLNDRKTQPNARIDETYGQLPLSFEPNEGQTDPQVDFISRGSGYTLFLTPREAVLTLRAASASSARTDDGRNVHESSAGNVLRMKFVGSQARPRLTAHEELPGKVNYFIGKDSRQWRT